MQRNGLSVIRIKPFGINVRLTRLDTFENGVRYPLPVHGRKTSIATSNIHSHCRRERISRSVKRAVHRTF